MDEELLKEKVKNQQSLVKRLKKVLNEKMVSIEGHFDQAVVFSFSNDFKIVICPQKSGYKSVFSQKGLLHIFDEDFKSLTLFSKGKLKNLEQEDGSLYINNSLFPFLKTQDSKAHAQVNYYNLYYHDLRAMLSQVYELGLNPGREFFLYGNNEISSRFSESDFKVKIPKKGLKVKVNDDSALILSPTDNAPYRSIDLFTGMGYLTKNFLYLGNLTEYRPVKSKRKGCVVSYNGATNERTYMMPVLKKTVNLKSVPKIAVEKADGKEFLLKKDKNTFYLQDDEGKIKIHHPDLLIYILE